MIALLMALHCQHVSVIINKTRTWTLEDRANLKSAKVRCKAHYPNSPCLKKFIKKGELTYWAVCGRQ